MRIELERASVNDASQACVLRAILLNDSYEPVAISRNAFLGPTPQTLSDRGLPIPQSVEPTYGAADEPLTLQPFSLYGRERQFAGLPAGELDVTASYRASDGSPAITASLRIRIEPRMTGSERAT